MAQRYDTTSTPLDRQPIRIAPARAPALDADVRVPGCRAALTALSIGLVGATAAGTVAVISHAGLAASVGAIAAVGWCSGVVAFSVELVHEKRQLAREVVWEYERATGRDINGDGVIGKPEQRPGVVIRGTPDNRDLTDQDEALDELEEFVRACYVDGHTAETYRVEGDGMDRDRYTYLRDVLIRGGYAEWISRSRPNVGWRFRASAFPTAESVIAGCRGLLAEEADNQFAYQLYLANGGPDAFRRQ